MSLAKIDSAKEIGIERREGFTFTQKATLTSEQTIDFDKWHGIYRSIPELQGIIDRLALWVVYGGDDEKPNQSKITFKSKSHEDRFNQWNGNGFDTPEDILYNLFRMGKIAGVSIAEKININKKGVVNLKPLNPGTIKIMANEKGFISKFEQMQPPISHDGKQAKPQTFTKDQIFYIAWNRIGDEIIGISTIEKLLKIIDYRHQAMEDLAEVFHRYVVPFWLFYADTDDEEEIERWNAKVKKIVKERDFMTIPKETIDKHERLAVPQFSTLDPLNWIKHLERYFLMCEGVPELIAGIGRETADASSRMIYLAWRIITIANQKILEKQIKAQTGIELTLPRPINILAPEINQERTQIQPKNTNKHDP